MDAFLQLDPSTCALHYNPSLFHQGPGAIEASQVFQFYADGRWKDAIDLAAGVQDAQVQNRLHLLISSVWHEQRHFVDLLLTNYGSFRIRQFFSVFKNFHVLAEMRDKKLHFPLDIYLDPVRLRAMRAEPASDNVKHVAECVNLHKKFLQMDRTTAEYPLGPIEIGGEAQIEALALYSQVAAFKKYFGDHDSPTFRYVFPNSEIDNLKYSWASVIGQSLGLQKGRLSEAYEIPLLGPLLYGALMMRYWPEWPSQEFSTFLPSHRFDALCIEVHRMRKGKLEMTVEDGWELVNAAAKKLWKRTILDDLDEDYEALGRSVDRLKLSRQEDDVVLRAYRDYYQVRGALISTFKQGPSLFLSLSRFEDDLVFRSRPIPILVAPHGQDLPPPAGFKRLLGTSAINQETAKLTQWWWTSVPSAFANSERSIAFKDYNAWISLFGLGPLSKIIMNGRCHRLMVGGELLATEQSLLDQGYNVDYENKYRFPSETAKPDFIYRLTARDSLECDACHRTIQQPAGHALSPWYFRKSRARAQISIDLRGGGTAGEILFNRDWSPWFVCDNCLKLLSAV